MSVCVNWDDLVALLQLDARRNDLRALRSKWMEYDKPVDVVSLGNIEVMTKDTEHAATGKWLIDELLMIVWQESDDAGLKEGPAIISCSDDQTECSITEQNYQVVNEPGFYMVQDEDDLDCYHIYWTDDLSTSIGDGAFADAWPVRRTYRGVYEMAIMLIVARYAHAGITRVNGHLLFTTYMVDMIQWFMYDLHKFYEREVEGDSHTFAAKVAVRELHCAYLTHLIHLSKFTATETSPYTDDLNAIEASVKVLCARIESAPSLTTELSYDMEVVEMIRFERFVRTLGCYQ